MSKCPFKGAPRCYVLSCLGLVQCWQEVNLNSSLACQSLEKLDEALAMLHRAKHGLITAKLGWTNSWMHLPPPLFLRLSISLFDSVHPLVSLRSSHMSEVSRSADCLSSPFLSCNLISFPFMSNMYVCITKCWTAQVQMVVLRIKMRFQDSGQMKSFSCDG